MSKKIAILQSNYIPWKGYFDLINSVDEFILYDTAQYTKNDWRNRNKIKTPNGIKWITIPVKQEKLGQLIQETVIQEDFWKKKHWNMLTHNYSKTKYFKEYKPIFEKLYLDNNEVYLSKINYSFIKEICEILNINTKIRWSSEFNLVDGVTEKLISICQQCEASEYLSGPAAKDYFDMELAHVNNIKVEWMDYNNYPQYNQRNGDFEHGVSILDLIFNEGPNSVNFMKSFGVND